MTSILPINIFNEDKTDYTNIRPFFNQPIALVDSINTKYTEVKKLFKQLKEQDWDELEFDYSTCNQEFKSCKRNYYDGMIKTLGYQWETDSVAASIVPLVISCLNPASEIFEYFIRVADNECVTPDHEVLTPTGWKYIDEVTKEDLVAQWNYESHFIDFVHPTDIISKYYRGDMYSFTTKSGNLSQITTPNHRMPLVYPYWNSNNGECREAHEVNYHGGNAIPVSGFLKHGREISYDERLWIAVQADGSIAGDRYTGTSSGYIHYKFSLTKERKIERLLFIANMLGYRTQELNTSRREKDGNRTFLIYVPVEKYNYDAKTFDWINFNEISQEWAEGFLDEIVHWDGNVHQSGNTRYISSNKKCIDVVSTIAHISGVRSHVVAIPPRSNVQFPGNISDTKEDYQIYISNRPFLPGNSIYKDVIEYDGMVHCLRVPSSYFLVRHNGIISVTGNCLHAVTYSEIVRNSFDNPDEVMSEILEVKQSLERLTAVAEVFSKTKEMVLEYALDNSKYSQELYNQVYLFLFTLFCMERIQFMASFAITFNICETTKMFQPIGAAVRKIALDEYEIHVQGCKMILAAMYEEEAGKTAYEANKDKMLEVLNEVVANEERWNEYLFNEVELVGLNLDLINKWVHFNATDVATTLSLTDGIKFKQILTNPLPFMESWLNIDNVQMSPQEEQPTNYKLGVVVDDSGEEEFDVDF